MATSLNIARMAATATARQVSRKTTPSTKHYPTPDTHTLDALNNRRGRACSEKRASVATSLNIARVAATATARQVSRKATPSTKHYPTPDTHTLDALIGGGAPAPRCAPHWPRR